MDTEMYKLKWESEQVWLDSYKRQADWKVEMAKQGMKTLQDVAVIVLVLGSFLSAIVLIIIFIV